MDYYKVPIGFGMELAMNHSAMEAYAAMTEQQKQTVLNKAHNARSEEEMHQIINCLVAECRQKDKGFCPCHFSVMCYNK